MVTGIVHCGRLLAASFIFVGGALCVRGQAPGDAELNQAYKATAQKDYDSAIELFRKGLALQPANAGAHKDLAYTLLKAGENADARDEFEDALRLNPGDETAALEYAFLAFETKEAIEARRTFDRLRKRGSAATRATAEQAFQNIDRPLAEGIARWKEALARSANPNDISMFSAHWELAQLAELRDELPLAAEQYEICRKLKPQIGRAAADIGAGLAAAESSGRSTGGAACGVAVDGIADGGTRDGAGGPALSLSL